MNKIRKNQVLLSHPAPERFLEIFEYIKAHPESPQSQKIEKVLDLMSSFRPDLNNQEEMVLFTRLRNALSTYRWSVRLGRTSEGLHAVHQMADKYAAGMSDGDRWEYTTIGFLLDSLPRLGERPRIRRCADCNQWFFAKNGKRVFCGDNCKQHNYDSDPEERVKKREYMRKRRLAEKEKEEKDKEGVRFRCRFKLIRTRRKRQH